jgi:peptidoglycan/LPS O-acetylase OafA/YrhL
MNSLEGASRNNNFGALRLLFAILVILSHSFELVDGNRSRELLTRIFGTISFGQLGVDGFFLISGYLITKSFQETRSVGQYVLKRVLRIYPGYVVAYLFSILIVAPIAGAQFEELLSPKLWLAIPLLREPIMLGVFTGMPEPFLNAPMWTIAYEFLCYLLVIAVGLSGLLSKRITLVIVTAVVLFVSSLNPHAWSPWFPEVLKLVVGNPDTTMWFAGVFGCGALHYLYQERIRYDWSLAILTAAALATLMFFPRVAESAIAILGGYILFWAAFNIRSPRLATVGRNVDLSYGMYLYAWPIQNLLIWFYQGISPWLVFIIATMIASIFAFVSWRFIEKPCLDFKNAFVPIGVKAKSAVERG